MRRVGTVVLGLSACGYPLTQIVMRHASRAGAGIVCAPGSPSATVPLDRRIQVDARRYLWFAA